MGESTSWQDELAVLRDSATGRQPHRTWEEVVREAHTTLVALHGLVALSTAEADADEKATTLGRDTATLSIDVLTEPLRVEGDPLRENFLRSLERISDDIYADIDLDALLTRLEGFEERQIRGLMNNVQGTLLELRVGEAFADGSFSFPEGVSGGVIADRNAAGVDGYFYDENHEIVDGFQIKASSRVGTVERHLDRHPDVETVLTNDELVTRSADAGIDSVHPAGVELEELMREDADAFVAEFETDFLEGAVEFSTGAIPAVTLMMLGAEVAWTWARHGDLDTKLDQVKGRATRAGVIAALAQGTSVVTGVESARLAVVLGVQGMSGAVGRIDRELASSIEHVRALRRQLDDLVEVAADSAA